ncbi:discoidin domain-containing protein [Phytoactinopolyspora halophila]|nr:discoidin domain-containing protein [Phytoactinopolyspora halophila]
MATLASSSALAYGPEARSNEQPSGASDERSVTFTLAAPPHAEGEDGPVLATVVCDGQIVASAELTLSGNARVTVPLDEHIPGPCRVDADVPVRDASTHEVTMTVREDGDPIERTRQYTGDSDPSRRVSTSEFNVAGRAEPVDLAVDITLGRLAADEVGTALRVMTFNIWQGGTLDPTHGAGMGEQNLDELVEFVRREDPDVLFVVETYGAGQRIEDGLNRDRDDGREFTGVQITREPGQDPDRDNLWMFTWLPVEEIYDRISGGGVSSFHFGGARLGLPDGGHVHAFSAWLHHQDSARAHANRAAVEETLDLCRYHSPEEIVATDERNRTRMAMTVLEDRLDTYTGNDGAPVIIGGDFNTLSHLDWNEQSADAFGHGGLVLDWPVTRMFADAGFTDTYRWAYPDAGRYPGSTMDPARGELFAPGRIDYILTRGDDVRVLDSATRTERLPGQQGSALDDRFAFYSDHAAVMTDLVIRGGGPGTESDRYRERVPLADEPVNPDATWPDEPEGIRVPAGELTAVASTEDEFREAGNAVDGDIRSYWHSSTSPVEELPHQITVDMQRVRHLSALRYQPRFNSAPGTILRATLQASRDGSDYTDVAEVDWDRTRLPKDVDLDGVSARYLRLTIERGSGGDLSSAAQLIPYETRSTGPPAEVPGPPSDEPGPPEVPGAPPFTDSQDVVVTTQTFHSDCARGYTEAGTWHPSSLLGHDGSYTRYSNVPDSTATWTPEIPRDGEYDVFVWWPDHPTATNSATYTVDGAGPAEDVTTDPADGMGEWQLLGRWPFEAGTSGDVTLTVGSGYHRTDAVRFRPVQHDPRP